MQHNSTTAHINIELQGFQPDTKVTITRNFNLQNKNVWQINNKNTSKDDVIKCVKKFNIQVNNLCQFLPQDRVQDFAKLNKQQLLKETQIALCKMDLSEKQNKACECSTLYLDTRNNLNKLKLNLEEIEIKKQTLDLKMEILKLKMQYINDIKNIDGKIAWLKYEEHNTEYQNILQDKKMSDEMLQENKKRQVHVPKAITKANNVLSSFSNKVQNYVSAI